MISNNSFVSNGGKLNDARSQQSVDSSAINKMLRESCDSNLTSNFGKMMKKSKHYYIKKLD